MAQDVPTLSLKGWVKDPQPKADRIMSYYFTTNYSQTNLFRGHAVSLQRQIQHYGHDLRRLASTVERELSSILLSYFDDASCDVRTDIPDPSDRARYNLTVSCIVVQDGVSYSLGRLIEVEGNAIKRILRYNNTGELTAP